MTTTKGVGSLHDLTIADNYDQVGVNFCMTSISLIKNNDITHY